MTRKNTIWYALTGVVLIAVFTAIIYLNDQHATKDTGKAESSIVTDNGDLKINWERYPSYDITLSESLTITQSGTYHITGSLKDQNITINVNDGKVKLILDDVTIDNSTGPAIACYAADDLVIELIGHNSLSDGRSYSSKYNEDVNGVIYSKGDLTFEGTGTLLLNANYQDGIVGKDDLKFNSGTYVITATDDGIRGKDSVYVVNGNFTITAKGDAIKSTNETTPGKGFVLIEQGTFNISAGDDGIHAISSLVIQNGIININKSYEGIEAKSITINGGTISITANDDGINAGGGTNTTNTQTNNPNRNPGALDSDANCILTINDGKIYVNAAGDGIDSNGYIYFNGGTITVDGPTNNGNGALDSGISITQTGGTVIAIGASGMAESLSNTSTIYNASIFFTSSQPASTNITIKDENGSTIINHTSAKSFNHLAVGTPDFKLNGTYTIYIDDKEYDSFTISNTTTTVGNTNNNQNMMPSKNQPRTR